MNEFSGTLVKYYNDGGFFMHPLLVLNIAAILVVLERFWAFYRSSTNVGRFMDEVRAKLLQQGVRPAMEACNQYRGSVVNVVKAGLLKFEGEPEEISKAAENIAIHEIARLERGLPVLASVANIAPMVGFLGTVAGMIQSFDVIAEQGLNDPGAVAKGISVALLTTAFGLIVALVAQPFFNYFSVRVQKTIRDMEASTSVLIETHEAMKRAGHHPGQSAG